MFASGVSIVKNPKVAMREPPSVTMTPSFVGRSKKGNNTGR
jgi:hypothetical protein